MSSDKQPIDELLINQAKADINVACSLFDKAEGENNEYYYGLSAYYAQQALEKALKAYIVHALNKKKEEISKYYHEIFPKYLNEYMIDILTYICKEYKDFTNQIFKFTESDKSYIVATFEDLYYYSTNFFCSLNFFFYDLQKFTKLLDKKYKEALFLCSLLTDKELKNVSSKLANHVNNIQEFRKKLVQHTDEIKSYVSKITEIQQKLLELMERESEGKEYVKKIEAILSKFPAKELPRELNELPPELQKELQKKFQQNYSLYRIIQPLPYILLMAYLFPHEDIGRYPSYIAGKPTINIYKENKGNLEKLINDTKEAVNDIKSNILTT